MFSEKWATTHRYSQFTFKKKKKKTDTESSHCETYINVYLLFFSENFPTKSLPQGKRMTNLDYVSPYTPTQSLGVDTKANIIH